MSKNTEITRELNQVMLNALLELKKLVDNDLSHKHDFLTIVKTFLVAVVSSTVDLVEVSFPGSAPMIYADVEATAKLGGLRAIAKWSSDYGSTQHSVSNIAEDDMTTAMNYVGQQLSTTLIKGLNELPMSLRNEEMLLRSVEVLLANLLNQKFKNNAHHILDSFCDHVHMALTDLESRAKH
jgi:hypothetical protein